MKYKNSKQIVSHALAVLILLITVSGSQAVEPGTALNVEKKGSGPAVLFIPGLISSSEVWADVADALQCTYACHLINLPGFAGQPALAEPPYLETFKRQILQYIENQNLANVTLVGHSLGGFISLMLALEKHPSVAKIIIIDALPFMAALNNPDAEEGFDEMQALQYQQYITSLPEPQLDQMRLMTAQGFTNDSTRWEQMIAWFNQSDPKTEAYASHEMFGMDLRKRIAAIDIPVQVIVPYHTNPFFPDYSLQDAKLAYQEQYKEIKDLELITIEQAKHFVMFDRPEALLDAIRRFLNN